MPVFVTCDCGKTLQTPPGARARKGKCPACGRVLLLPATAEGPSPAAAPPARPKTLAPGQAHLRPRKAGAIRAIAFEPNGPLLALAHETGESGAKGGLVVFWDATTGKEIAVVRGHRDRLHAIAFSANGEQAIVAGQGGALIVWEIARGMWEALVAEKGRTLEGHKACVTCLALSSDGALLGSVAEDRSVRLWNAADWQCETVWEAGRSGAGALAFSPAGGRVAAAWRNRGPVMMWELPKRTETARLQLPREEDREDFALAFAARGETLAVLSVGEVRLWDLATHQVLISVSAENCRALAAGPDGQVFALGGHDEDGQALVRLHDVNTGELTRSVALEAGPVTSLAWSPDGRTLAIGCQDGTLAIWPQ